MRTGYWVGAIWSVFEPKYSPWKARLAGRVAIAVVAGCLGARATGRTPESPTPGDSESAISTPADSSLAQMYTLPEREDNNVRLALDEHLFVNGTRDRDYAGGGEITVSGSLAARKELDPVLGWVDQHAMNASEFFGNASEPTHALAAGLLVFTPRDLQQRTAVPGDRPYASLFFLGSGRRYLATDRPTAYQSSFTFGLLGLGAAGSLQSALHQLTGSVQPQGWSHQISAGGEPTVRYGFARQALLVQQSGSDWFDYDLKWTSAASVGTVTEGSVALAMRWGLIASPWWAFSPEQNVYADEVQPAPPPLAAISGQELFVLLGVRTKVRAYNAFLEGQFRHSDLRYSPDRLNPVLGEGWAGFEFRTSAGFEMRYLVRWESPELRTGIGSRSFVWGTVELTASFGQ